jgi:membrane dipeptidase
MPEQPGAARFDFGLTAGQEERARRLHEESIVVDMLFVGPCGPLAFTEEMNAQLRAEYSRHHDAERTFWSAMALPGRLAALGQSPVFREWWEASGVTAGSREVGVGPIEQALEHIGNFTREFDGLDWLVKALTAGDIRRAQATGKRAGFLHMQDTRAIDRDLDRLDRLYNLGLRILQLTYNSLNYVGAGCTERTDAGLSYFGVRLVERMNALGMLVDISHTGRQSTLDACRVSRAPVVATHTGAGALSGHDRCKSDEVLRAIAATGGIVGVVTVPAFLSTGPDPAITDFLDHVDYLANLIGVEHVGIGTDWPNGAPEWVLGLLGEWAKELGFREEHRVNWLAQLKGFRDYREFINITRGLVARGYSDEQIQAILGGNFLRVFEQVCG